MRKALRRSQTRLAVTLGSRRGVASVAALGVLSVGAPLTAYFYGSARVASDVERRVRGGLINPSIEAYPAPLTLEKGQRWTPKQITATLKRRGYYSGDGKSPWSYRLTPGSVELGPAQDASGAGFEGATVKLRSGRVRGIDVREGSGATDSLSLPQAPFSVVPDGNRDLRRPVHVGEIPAMLAKAVIAVEDHRFYDHDGIDLVRTVRAAYDGVLEWRRPRGTSTLTQQLARNVFLSPEQTYRRKLAEFFVAQELEDRLDKRHILEAYLNQVYMGRVGSFNIRGMAMAAEVYFGKRVSQLDLPEAATLAGLLQRPSYLNPFEHPERDAERRNVVLGAMRRAGYVDSDQYRRAVDHPVQTAPMDVDAEWAPYFLEILGRELSEVLGESPNRSVAVHSTIDPDLQAVAVESVRVAIEVVDRQVARQERYRGVEAPKPQVALVALDPRTGAIRALVGGRRYAASQLNRALSRRQPGSTFKPVVFAAALESGLTGDTLFGSSFTLASPINDELTTFHYGDEIYEPTNFGGETQGVVTLRDALVHSINIPTVHVAEQVGYNRVAKLGRRAGMGNVRGTPAAALGAYEASPLQVAAAYTVFANGGERVEPHAIELVRDATGTEIYRAQPRPERVVDERVAYLITNALEDVINRGTGYGVRRAGFQAHVAGKTGTDEDGWFAGFTSNLLTVVWIGFDDNRDLELESADSALPVWAEFMKRAHQLPQYSDPQPFRQPEGVEREWVDLTPLGYDDGRYEFFLEGTAATVRQEIADYELRPPAEPALTAAGYAVGE